MFKKVFAVFSVFLFLALIHLMINAQIVYLGYKIDAMKRSLSKIRSENRSLAASAAQKQNLSGIDYAAKKMGMFIPATIYFITSQENSKLNKGNRF